MKEKENYLLAALLASRSILIYSRPFVYSLYTVTFNKRSFFKHKDKGKKKGRTKRVKSKAGKAPPLCQIRLLSTAAVPLLGLTGAKKKKFFNFTSKNESSSIAHVHSYTIIDCVYLFQFLSTVYNTYIHTIIYTYI